MATMRGMRTPGHAHRSDRGSVLSVLAQDDGGMMDDDYDALTRAARALRAARKRLDAAMDGARDAAIAAAAAGISEVSIAEILEVHRLTVRKWLGKPRRR